MEWQPPAPVSRKYRYTVLTLILVFVAFLAVVAIWAFSGLFPADAIRG
jgi:hypothetical protein